MSARVIVSISGIGHASLELAADFAAELDARAIPLSILIAPRQKGKYRLIDDDRTVEWLQGRLSAGDSLVLNGYDQAATRRRRAEFAALPESEALLRLTAADYALGQVGLGTKIFAPPRWVASAGAMAALPRAGFLMCADLVGIHDLRAGTMEAAKVFGVGEGFVAEPWWCKAIIMGAGRSARRGETVRLSIAAKHLDRPVPRQGILEAIDYAVHCGAVAARYEVPVSDAGQVAAEPDVQPAAQSSSRLAGSPAA